MSNRGKYSTGTNWGSCRSHKFCPKGQYISTVGQSFRDNSCSSCPSGKYSSFRGNARVCCTNGFPYSSLGTRCSTTRCSAGTEVASTHTSCVDINECSRNLDKCHRDVNCVNTLGTYQCKCPVGFVFNTDTNLETITFGTTAFTENRACIKQPLQREIQTTSTSLKIDLDNNNNKNVNRYTKYQVAS